ncbi:beta carbonic anhydrase 5, chloroplastic isoform X2 [Mercurialis annua]|uniref:beta carbonic anhydrase 5, chloroplastic isoform X2 n=1 Tax=Mercurialis annua TaxID=3986 RepID=UPI00215E739A|nr:beta carbonic anhydrase 5, chloroplastic isoform X2 [Mercurialis annua]
MANLSPSCYVSKEPFCSKSLIKPIFESNVKLGGTEHTRLRLCAISNNANLKLKASKEPPGATKELRSDKMENPSVVTKDDGVLFDDMKQHFMNFKKNTYMENLKHFENLSKGQSPKFMVIACADSRVCPSNILGFQPGEAFVVRNVANMVPSYESGPSETNAALEFAVNSLNVENILIIGHSCCGGIRALMSMHDDVETSSFIGSWVSVGMNARLKTKAAATNLSFDRQCRHCEKESVNCSLTNLLTYPWIEEKVRNDELSLHGGYYDFVDCAFEKWTLDYKASNLTGENGKIAVKDRAFWC